jgi:DNA helicase MCM8
LPCCRRPAARQPGQLCIGQPATRPAAGTILQAGILASLPARTSIIAAANPVDGHYNRAKTIQENLKMSPAMLSRWALRAAARWR